VSKHLAGAQNIDELSRNEEKISLPLFAAGVLILADGAVGVAFQFNGPMSKCSKDGTGFFC
jgi:hypothetical protein